MLFFGWLSRVGWCYFSTTFVLFKPLKMQLKTLSIVNFKNYEEARLELHEGTNVFVGNNGEGKTNLLDAIYYLSFCKSFFNPIDSQNIRHGLDFFVVQGEFEKLEKKEAVYCGIKRNQKKQFKRNKKEYPRLADHIGLLPLVMVSPADGGLIHEGSEVRRKFIDGVIAQHDKGYLDNLLTYGKVLSQRNALLKHFAESRTFEKTSLDIWSEQLAALGQQLHAVRVQFLEDFEPVFQRFFADISGGKELVQLEYRSHLHEGAMVDLLEATIGKDRGATYTTTGIHKDDLVFKLGDHPLKKFGSQGQQKSYLLALKLAQMEYIKSVKGVTPILLLDDIFDKLDDVRVTALMQLVNTEDFGQIFVTDTSSERIEKVFKNAKMAYRMFQVKSGQVSDVQNFKID